MTGAIVAAVIFFAVGYGAAYLQGRTARPRHQHYWEVVEKKELPSAVEQSGGTLGDLLAAVKKANSYGYAPNTDSVLRLTARPIVVHYRCPCGAEKVERE